MTDSKTPTAAVLLIGNELLSGKIRDRNGYALSRMLRRRGIRLVELVVVEDDDHAIAGTLHRLLARTPLIFTSGGVGPTHDDRTIPAIASALDRPLRRHPEMEALLRKYYGDKIGDVALRMADLPEGTSLRAGTTWPILRLDLPHDHPAAAGRDARIYILPGVPELCQAKIDALEAAPDELPNAGGWLLLTVETNIEERVVAPVLQQYTRDFPQLEIGSYPRWDRQKNGKLRGVVRVTLEAPVNFSDDVKRAQAQLEAELRDLAATTAQASSSS